MHAQLRESRSSHRDCNHSNKGDHSSCSLSCGDTTHELTGVSASLQLMVLPPSIRKALLIETRNYPSIEDQSPYSLSASPPDQPPRR